MPPERKNDPKPHGPKERELAVALTVAVLNAAKLDGALADVEHIARGVYGRMLAALTEPAASLPGARHE